MVIALRLALATAGLLAWLAIFEVLGLRGVLVVLAISAWIGIVAREWLRRYPGGDL